MIDALRALLVDFPDAVITGVVISVCLPLLGVFVVLRRMVFIGITLSEVAALGVATGLAAGWDPYIVSAVFTVAVAALLAQPFSPQRIPSDAVLGVLFVGASAGAILIVSQGAHGLAEVKNLLYGDLIFALPADRWVVLSVLPPVAAYLLLCQRPTLTVFLDSEAARVAGFRVRLWEFAFFFALGLAVAAASRVAGVLLVFCFLAVTPATALLLARRMTGVLIAASVCGALACLVGLTASTRMDLPANQAIAVAACGFFAVTALYHGLQLGRHRTRT